MGLHVRLLIMTVIDPAETDRRRDGQRGLRQGDRQPERKSTREYADRVEELMCRSAGYVMNQHVIAQIKSLQINLIELQVTK